jgi:hypothetical protein
MCNDEIINTVAVQIADANDRYSSNVIFGFDDLYCCPVDSAAAPPVRRRLFPAVQHRLTNQVFAQSGGIGINKVSRCLDGSALSLTISPRLSNDKY